MTSGDRREKSRARALGAESGRSFSGIRNQAAAGLRPDLTDHGRRHRLSHLYGKTYAEVCVNLEIHGLQEGARRVFESGLLPCHRVVRDGISGFVLDEKIFESIPSMDVWILLAASGSPIPGFPDGVPEEARSEAMAAYDVVEACRENRLGVLVGWTDHQVDARSRHGLLMILREAVLRRQAKEVVPGMIPTGDEKHGAPSESLRIHLEGGGLVSLKKEIERHVGVRGVLVREVLGTLPPPIKGTSARNQQRIWLSRDSMSDGVIWKVEPAGKWTRAVHATPELSEKTAMDFLMDSFAFSYLVDSCEPPKNGLAALPNIKGCSLTLMSGSAEDNRVTVWKPVVGEGGATGYWSPSHPAAEFLSGMDIPVGSYERGGHLLGNPEEQDQAILALLRMVNAMKEAASKGESFDLGPTLAEVKALVDSSEAKRNSSL